MKNQVSNYKPFDKFILRTPILSLDKIQNISENVLKELCKNQIISESIYVASPELYREMLKFIINQSIDGTNSLSNSLAKYLIRMGSRCTPFGLFSGCTIGELSAENSAIELSDEFEHKKFTRIDMNYVLTPIKQEYYSKL